MQKNKANTGWAPQICQKGAFHKNDYGLHTDNKLHVSQMYALVMMKTNHSLGCIYIQLEGWGKCLFFIGIYEATSGVLCPQGPQDKKNWCWFSRQPSGLSKGWCTYGEVKSAGFVWSEEEKVWNYLTAVFNYWMGGQREVRDKIFPVMQSGKSNRQHA